MAQWWVWWALGKQTVGPLIDLWFEIVWTLELSWMQWQKLGNRAALEWTGGWGRQQPSLLFTAPQSRPRSESSAQIISCSLSLDNLSLRFGFPRTIDLAGILAPAIPLGPNWTFGICTGKLIAFPAKVKQEKRPCHLNEIIFKSAS